MLNSNRKRLPHMIKTMDKNKDGGVNKDEFPAHGKTTKDITLR